MRDLRVAAIAGVCAAFDQDKHGEAVAGLSPVAEITTIAQTLHRLAQNPAGG